MQRQTSSEMKQLHPGFYLTQPASDSLGSLDVSGEFHESSLLEHLEEHQKKFRQGKSKWHPKKNHESLSKFVGYDVEEMVEDVKIAGKFFSDTTDEACSLKATVGNMERCFYSKRIDHFTNGQLQSFRMYPNTSGVPVFPVVSRKQSKPEVKSSPVPVQKEKASRVKKPKGTGKVATPKKKEISPTPLGKGVIAQGEFQTPPQVIRYLAQRERDIPKPESAKTTTSDRGRPGRRSQGMKTSTRNKKQQQPQERSSVTTPIIPVKPPSLKMTLKLGPNNVPSITKLEIPPERPKLICKIPMKYYLNIADQRNSS